MLKSFVIFISSNQPRSSLEGVIDCDSEPPLISRWDVFGLKRVTSLLIHSTCGVVVKSVHSHFPWLQLFTRLWRQAALRSMLTCHADFIFNSPSSLVNVKYCAPLKGVWVPRRQGSLLLSCTFCHFAKQFSFVSSAVMAADSSVSPARGSSTGVCDNYCLISHSFLRRNETVLEKWTKWQITLLFKSLGSGRFAGYILL